MKIKPPKSFFENLLRGNGLKATPKRIELLILLENINRPISVKEIIQKIKFNFDRASLYRAIEEFKNKKIISKVNLKDGESYYEFINNKNGKEHHHHHIVCDDCGKIEEVEICFRDDFKKKILKNSKNFSSSLHHSLEFFGRCDGCARSIKYKNPK